eukprot:TRINITY_DN3238_c0_g1_i7.p6 TRINITY_DN3238_c0_g1~~TRINITY_DN3238_c0_g1_i7.p6  ORF type:complete len:145 (-),score=14.83 TRINITY_DN3238_c0_g1_i7:452-886(-)
MHGKGHVGDQQGIEVIFDLKGHSNFFDLDTNFQAIQDNLNTYREVSKLPVCSYNKEYDEFNGFFFGLKKSSMRKLEINQTTLFDPERRNVGQEYDLRDRTHAIGQKLCLNKISFVFHYKASTITDDFKGDDERNAFVRPDVATN